MRTFIALFIGLFGGHLLAETPQQPKQPPVITRIVGQVPTAVFADGREAEYRAARGTEFPIPVPFKVSENLCLPQKIGIEFNANFKMRVDQAGWFWTKHPDRAKIDQILIFGASGMQTPLFTFAFVTNATAFKYPDLKGDFSHDELIVNDLSWLPGMELGPHDFTVDVWNAEQMVNNSQTGLPENRISGGANGVHFKNAGNGKLEIEFIDSVFSLRAEDAAFAMIGDVVSWQWQANGQRCQIAFKPNLGPANALVRQKLSQMNTGFVPYVWGSDSLQKVLIPILSDESLAYAE